MIHPSPLSLIEMMKERERDGRRPVGGRDAIHLGVCIVMEINSMVQLVLSLLNLLLINKVS